MKDWKNRLAEIMEQTLLEEVKVTAKRLQVGCVIKVALNENDGLVLQAGKKERDKFIVIIGVTADGNLIGALLINTAPALYTKELEECQYLVRKSVYPKILEYDSWLNCGSIFSINRQKLISRGIYLGALLEEDIDRIMTFLKETDLYTPKEKRKFGIIK